MQVNTNANYRYLQKQYSAPKEPELGIHRKCEAPLQSNTAPVHHVPAPAKKKTASATSSTSPTRFQELCARMPSPRGPSRTLFAMSVAMNPGATAATRMPCESNWIRHWNLAGRYNYLPILRNLR